MKGNGLSYSTKEKLHILPLCYETEFVLNDRCINKSAYIIDLSQLVEEKVVIVLVCQNVCTLCSSTFQTFFSSIPPYAIKIYIGDSIVQLFTMVEKISPLNMTYSSIPMTNQLLISRSEVQNILCEYQRIQDDAHQCFWCSSNFNEIFK